MAIPKKVCGIPFPVAVVIALILVYAYIFGRPTILIWYARQEAAHNPRVAMVPMPLPDTSISTTPGNTVAFFGWQFEVPWQGPVAVKNPGEYIAVAYMPLSQRTIGFFNPAENKGLLEPLRQELKNRGMDPRNADEFLGAQSDYDLERNIWYTTPAQLSLIFPRRKAVFAATRLMIKGTQEREASTGVYAFTIGLLRGFQFGDPARVSSVHVDGFDEQDRKFEFIIGSKPGPMSALKQSEINRVLQTLRAAPAAQSEGPAKSVGK
jgi:hypothetical protein